MGYELLVILSLAVGATVFVVTVSIGLVIHKFLNVRTTRRRKRLYEAYSGALAKVLLQEIPPLPRDARTSAIFDRYEEMIRSLKERIDAAAPRRRTRLREALRQALIDFARDMTGEVSGRLVYYFYSFGFVDDQIRLLSDRRWWVRAQAARDAGILKARRTITALTAALEDEHPDVRIQAMESLIRIVGVEALRTIFRVSRGLSLWTSVELSVIVLDFGETAVPFLIEGLGSADQSIVMFCVEMLSAIGFVHAVEPLRAIAAGSQNVVVRARAIEALGRLGDERAEDLLIESLGNPNPEIRTEALNALGRIGTPHALHPLVRMLRSGSLAEKIAAGRAIVRTGTAGTEILRQFEHDDDPLLAGAAGQVIEEREWEAEQ